MARAVICQRFITNQRLRLSQQCDMICGESKQNHWSVILQPHPCITNGSRAHLFHSCQKSRSFSPFLLLSDPSILKQRQWILFLFPQSLRIFFGHAPSFFARLSVFSSFLEKKYCTLWRYILRLSVCCWVSFIVCLRSDSARRPLKNIQHRIFKQKFLIQESTCQIWIGNLKNY